VTGGIQGKSAVLLEWKGKKEKTSTLKFHELLVANNEVAKGKRKMRSRRKKKGVDGWTLSWVVEMSIIHWD